MPCTCEQPCDCKETAYLARQLEHLGSQTRELKARLEQLIASRSKEPPR